MQCSFEVLENSSGSWLKLLCSLYGMECVQVGHLQADDRGCDLCFLMVVVLLSFDDEVI